MSEFAVVRTWKTGKRSFSIVVGPFSTRSVASTYLKQAIIKWGIPTDQLHVATFRKASVRT